LMHRDLESAVADGETSPPKREGTSAMGQQPTYVSLQRGTLA